MVDSILLIRLPINPAVYASFVPKNKNLSQLNMIVVDECRNILLSCSRFYIITVSHIKGRRFRMSYNLLIPLLPFRKHSKREDGISFLFSHCACLPEYVALMRA